MIDEGYAATQILSQFHDLIIEEKLGDKQKSVIAEKMAVSCKHRCYTCQILPFLRNHPVLY